MRRRVYLLTAFLLALTTVAAAADGNDKAFIADPPAEYRRPVVIEAADIDGRPLAGVAVRVTPYWGMAYPSGELTTDEFGRVRFELKPVVENPMKDIRVTDHFLTYRAVFFYRLVKDGYMETVGEKEDVQEFASFSHPLYYGLNRTPDDAPLVIREQMAAYEDFLARPDAQHPGLRKLIEALIESGPAADIRLTPGTLFVDREGRLGMGFRFTPLFDPEQYGLAEAGRVLLKKPIRDCLAIVDYAFPDREKLASFEFRVQADFQYRGNPFPEPVAQTFVFQMPASSARTLQAWRPGRPLPGDGIHVKVLEPGLDLTGELWPQN